MTARGHSNGCGDRRVWARTLSARTAARFVDLHCHCLPNLDDGPDSAEEAVALCRALVRDHVCTVVATPHQLGRFETRIDASEIRQMVQCLNEELVNHGIDLKVLPGAEVRLDERLADLLAEEKVLTLADMGRHILLELPANVFIDIEPLILQLRSQGIDLLIAHPERNAPLLGQPRALRRWLDCGVSLQVTAASLLGDFGPQAEEVGWAWMAEGWVAVVATDAHDHDHGPPHMTEVFQLIEARVGRDPARSCCVDNPSRVVRGERLVSPHLRDGQGGW